MKMISGKLLVSALSLIFILGVLQIAQAGVSFISNGDFFTVDRLLQVTGNVSIGDEFVVPSAGPFIRMGNNLIFRGGGGIRPFSGESTFSITDNAITASQILLRSGEDLFLRAKGGSLLLTGTQGGETTLNNSGELTALQGASTTQTGQISPNTLGTTELVASSIEPLSGGELRLGTGNVEVEANFFTRAAVSELQYDTIDSGFEDLCRVVPIAYDPIANQITNDCNQEFGTNSYVLDVDWNNREMVCCKACRLSASVSSPLPVCDAGLLDSLVLP